MFVVGECFHELVTYSNRVFVLYACTARPRPYRLERDLEK